VEFYRIKIADNEQGMNAVSLKIYGTYPTEESLVTNCSTIASALGSRVIVGREYTVRSAPFIFAEEHALLWKAVAKLGSNPLYILPAGARNDYPTAILGGALHVLLSHLEVIHDGENGTKKLNFVVKEVEKSLKDYI
jgi:hypothetical protein